MSVSGEGVVPDLIPARMINQFSYCPRLFHLEWVQGQFATSDDVEEGLYVHRVVDGREAISLTPRLSRRGVPGEPVGRSGCPPPNSGSRRSWTWLKSTGTAPSSRSTTRRVDPGQTVVLVRPTGFSRSHR